MEKDTEEIDNKNSNHKFKKVSKKYMLSNLSISDDPIPYKINSPKSRNENHKNINSIFKPNIKELKQKRSIKLLLSNNIKRYDSSPEKYNINVINNLINLKENSLVAVFKDNLLICNDNEFLRGNFNINECIEVLPKFYDYYKNYLMFFCNPTFNNFYINDKIQEYGEKQAEVFYNNNYISKKQKGKKENIDEKNIDQDDMSSKSSKLISSDNNDNNNETSLVSFRNFFTNSVESMIKKGINSMNNKKGEEPNKELSNIKPKKTDNEENTLYLPDDSSISLENVITKKNSIRNIIDLMKHRNIDMDKMKDKKNNLSNQKDKQIKKKGIIIIDKKKLIEGRNLFNKKRFNSFSKTTLNLLDKNKTKKKVNKNSKINTNYNFNSNNKAQPNSNYLKYVGVLKQNKYIKINNIPKIKVSENDLILSPTRNIKTKKKSFNKIPSFKTSENNFNLMTSNSNTNNLKNSKSKYNNNITKTNKIKLPLKIKNFYKKIKNITNNSNSSIQLSICKTTNNRNNSTNKNFKTNNNIVNRTNYNFNKNNKYIEKLKVLPLLSPKSKSNLCHNKSLSYSTINNCNININNNIILSNNYIYNNKYLCYHNSQKQLNFSKKTKKDKSKSKSKDKQINKREKNIEPKKIKNSIPLTSRNIRINLDKFRTEENFLNSLMHQGTSKKNIIKNKNDKSENNIQYTSFRKSSNKEVINNKYKKINNNKNNKNLVLKDVLIMNKTKNNLNKNNDNNSLTKTYKSIYIKNNNNGNNQRKLIFEYNKRNTYK